MKKLILLASLLIVSLVEAQDFTYLDSLNKMNLDQAKSTADKIINSTGEKYELLRMTESDQYNNLEFEYVPVNLTASEKEKYSFSITKHPLTIRFSIYYIGENKDLEIKGEKAFKLSEVKGKYLEVAQYWIKTFYPNATPETVLATYDLKTFYKREAHLKFMLQKNNEIWKLINVSN